MPSTYTLNNGIELIGTGEQSGTWGDTTNTNLELLDTALDGQVTVTLASAGTSGSPNTLPISDGAASDGRNRMVIFDDSSDLGSVAFVQLTPNDAEKIIYVRNDLSGSRGISLFQGTYSASNDYVVPAGTTAVVYFDGAGSGAVAANVFNNAHFDAMNIVGNADVGGNVDIGGNVDVGGTLSVTGETTATGNLKVDTINEITAAGGVTIDSVLLKDGDITGTIGGSTASAGAFTTLTASGNVELDTNTLTVNATNNRVGVGISVADIGHRLGMFGGTGSDATFLIRQASDSADSGLINFKKTRGTTYSSNTAIQDGDQIGRTIYQVANGTNTDLIAAEVKVDVPSVAAYNNGRMQFITKGQSRLVLNYNTDGVVFNEPGNDYDFRVESDTNTNMLFVDASTNRVGIGSGSPVDTLDVSSGNIYIGSSDDTTNTRSILGAIASDSFTLDGLTIPHYSLKWGNSSGGSPSAYLSGYAGVNLITGGYARMKIGASETVINDDQLDYNFRVEGDTNAHLFFVDGGLETVGIKSSTPSGTLQVGSGVVNVGANTVKPWISYQTGMDFGGDASPTYSYGSLSSRVDFVSLSNNFYISGSSVDTIANGSAGDPRYAQQLYLSDGAFVFEYSSNQAAADNTAVSSWVQTLNLLRDAVVVNESGVDVDFRVESNLADYMFFVDASSDKIGINTSVPAQMLTVNGGMLRVTGSMTDPNDSGGAHFWNQSGVGPTISGLSTMIRGGGTGSQVELAKFSTSEIRFNEDSGQTDFRVESDSNSHMLFVDGGENQVLIGHSVASKPESKMEVETNSTSDVAAKTNIDDYATGSMFTIRRNENTGSVALRLSGNDDISAVIEQGRTNSGSNWESYLRFYNKNAATGSPANVDDISEFMTIYGDDYLRLASGTLGIQFGGASGSGDALYDVEYGTWTPDLQFSGAKVGITYERVHGTYLKVNNMVQATARLRLTSKGTSTGNAQIHGLPFPTAYGSMNGYLNRPCPVFTDSAAGTQLSMFGFKTDGNAYISLVDGTSNGRSNMTNSNFTNATYLTFQIFYDTGS